MALYSLLAAAKVNLYLEIVGDRPDGFHELIMVMQSISLADRVTVRSIGLDTIRLVCHHPLVPADETNLAYRAAALLAQRFPGVMTHRGGVEITLDKQIPVGAGLAGGSSNAAAVLVGLDLLWNLGLTQGELQELGAELGSDVPFAIAGGTMFATGRGEQLNPLPGLHHLWVVLAKYGTEMVSTPGPIVPTGLNLAIATGLSSRCGDRRSKRVPCWPPLAIIKAATLAAIFITI
jgi:4-diphosphocytidyl-2-C-methyl-D-erythritol kinase